MNRNEAEESEGNCKLKKSRRRCLWKKC